MPFELGVLLDESHEIDDRLGRQAGHSCRADVVYLGTWQQRYESHPLRVEARRPRRVILDNLDRGVLAARACEVMSGCVANGLAAGTSTFHNPSVADESAHAPIVKSSWLRSRNPLVAVKKPANCGDRVFRTRTRPGHFLS